MPKDPRIILFEEYTEIEEEFESIKRATNRIVDKRSDIVEKIFSEFGSGPFKFRGIYYTVSKRTNRLTGKDTYFFKSPNKSFVEEI